MKLLIKNGAKPDYTAALKKAKIIRFKILRNILKKVTSELTKEQIETATNKRNFDQVIAYLEPIYKKDEEDRLKNIITNGLKKETITTVELSFKKVIDYLEELQGKTVFRVDSREA